MRAAVMIVLVPAMLSGQEPTPQPGSASPDEWLKQVAAATDRYGADRAKLREKFDKNLQNVERREKDALAISRDEFRSAEASWMDPQAFQRGVEARLRFVQWEDSSAARFVAGRRSGQPARIRGALAQRLADVQGSLASVDTALKYAKEMRKRTQKSLDNLKASDRPGAPAAQREYVRKMLDYYDKLDRLAAAREVFYGGYSEMMRKEIGMLEQEIARSP